MAGLREYLTEHNHAQAKCVEVTFVLTECGIFCTEVMFAVERIGTDDEWLSTELIEAISHVDIKYFSQYSNDFLMKQIFQELLLDLELKLLESRSCH